MLEEYFGNEPLGAALTQQDPSDNLKGRMRCWQGAVSQIKDNRLTGTGPDTFTQAYPAYQVPGSAVLGRYAHNDYLHFTAETGILFIPVLIYTLYCFFRSGFQKLKSRSRQTRGIALGAMAAVFAILIHSFSDFNLKGLVLTSATLGWGQAFVTCDLYLKGQKPGY